jgi:hypothetical protein
VTSGLIAPRRAVGGICIAAVLLAPVGMDTTVSAAALPDAHQIGASADRAAGVDSGQVGEGDDPATEDEDEFDGRSTADTVRVVVGSLIAVAGATAILMLVFIWHTSPRRRFRVANRRAERRRAEVTSDEDDMAVNDDEVDQVEGEEVDGDRADGDEVEGDEVDGNEAGDGADRSEDAEVEESRE